MIFLQCWLTVIPRVRSSQRTSGTDFNAWWETEQSNRRRCLCTVKFAKAKTYPREDRSEPMLCTDTFVVELYCLVDDFCKGMPPSFVECNIWDCGRKRSLSRSEVVTLSIFGQLWRFRSERDF